MTDKQLSLIPRARQTDPPTAHNAASLTQPGNHTLTKTIRNYVWTHGPSTSFEIADALQGRWQHDTIRTACARAGLVKFEGGITPGGRACLLYGLYSETVDTGNFV